MGRCGVVGPSDLAVGVNSNTLWQIKWRFYQIFREKLKMIEENTGYQYIWRTQDKNNDGESKMGCLSRWKGRSLNEKLMLREPFEVRL